MRGKKRKTLCRWTRKKNISINANIPSMAFVLLLLLCVVSVRFNLKFRKESVMMKKKHKRSKCNKCHSTESIILSLGVHTIILHFVVVVKP